MARRQQLTEIERLRLEAEELWEQQQAVLSRASRLAKDAAQDVSEYTRDELVPKARQTYSNSVAALGSAIAAVQAFKDKQVRDALTTAGRIRVQAPVVLAPAPKKSSAGLWVGIGIGVVAAAAVSYVVWQTLRADDELWIEDELPAA